MSSVPQIFQFEHNGESTEIRTTVHNGEPYFVGTDVCQVLGLEDVSKTVSRLDDDEKLTRTLFVSGQNRNVLLVTESGLYHLVFTSRKPEAQTFRRWVTQEVLPSIRKTGSYSTQSASFAQDDFEFRFQVTCKGINDIRRTEQALARIKEAHALLTGNKRTVNEDKAHSPRYTPPLTSIGPVKKSLEEKILQYIETNQHTSDRDRIPTVRNLSRYIKECPPVRLKVAVQGLLDQGKIVAARDGKAYYYQLAA